LIKTGTFAAHLGICSANRDIIMSSMKALYALLMRSRLRTFNTIKSISVYLSFVSYKRAGDLLVIDQIHHISI